MAKPKKTLYHSELVNLGPVEVEIKSDVKASQYPNQNDYVIMTLDGHDRNYSCENDDCADALKQLDGQTVIIEATGSREDAQIIVSEATGGGNGRGNDRRQEPRNERRDDRRDDRREERRETPRREERSQRQESRREEAPPRDERRQEQTDRRPASNQRPQPTAEEVAKAEAWAIHHFKQGLGKFINAEIMIHQAAVIARDEIKARTGYDLTDAAFQAMTSSAWIFLKDTGKLQALPSRMLPKAGAAPKQTQAPTENRRDDARQPDGRGEAPQPGPHEPPPDDDVPF